MQEQEELYDSSEGQRQQNSKELLRQSSRSACELHRTHVGEATIRKSVTFSERKFDVQTLPADMLRVYRALEERYGEEYGLLFVFNMITAIELHRAWNMTLLTSKTMKRVTDLLGLRMTWHLGAIFLRFCVEDGDFELQRKVPFDYDSEFQDMFVRIASALYGRHLTVHEALLFQQETIAGKHTAGSGLFLRKYPGRLVLLPFMASTCTVIFFGGTGKDAGVAAICGLVCGLIDYGLSTMGGEATIIIDLGVGLSTGIIGSLFYRFDGGGYCLSSIFLGTMYWFFYGTAFVIGLLEIIAGELETGVTRFMAVNIKTFVLCLMACMGMLLTLPEPAEVWYEQSQNCGTIDLAEKWWRIPLYLACCVSVLGQYRFRADEFWRGLTVQLVAYEVQFQVSTFFVQRSGSQKDNLHVMVSNIAGCACAVLTASFLRCVVDKANRIYYNQILQRGKHRDDTDSMLDDILYYTIAAFVRCFTLLGLGRSAEKDKVKLERKLRAHAMESRDSHNDRLQGMQLELEEENLLLDTIVYCESMNLWSLLMPAVYQLVPGSMIAKLWFNSIIPNPNDTDNVFAGLMVTSLSLALGLVIGDFIVELIGGVFSCLTRRKADESAGQAVAEGKSGEREGEEAKDEAKCTAVEQQELPGDIQSQNI